MTRFSVEGQCTSGNFVLRLTALCVGQVKDNKIAGVNASISALEFFSTSLTLAIGNDFGLVRIRTVSVFRFPWNNENRVLPGNYTVLLGILQVFLYKFDGTHERSSLHLITEKQREGAILYFPFSSVVCLGLGELSSMFF